MTTTTARTFKSFCLRACLSALTLLAAVGNANAAGASDAGLATAACAAPAFPVRWQDAGDSGTVILEVLVAPNGKVLSSKVVESSGIARVDRASMKASEQCHFQPAVADEKGTPNWAKVQYTWVLE